MPSLACLKTSVLTTPHLQEHTHTQEATHADVPIYACAFAQMYVEGSVGFSLVKVKLV